MGIQLAFTVAGAAVGGVIGGPMGARVGVLAGSFIGGAIESRGQRIEGPRMDDLQVTSSTYGSPIPVVYGTVRIGSNIIWTSGIRERRSTSRAGGKGGGFGPQQVSYSYSADFAVGICEGVIDDVTRIWADNKLIYDKTGQSGPVTNLRYSYRLYKGTETQLPDATIVAAEGEENTPAFRGLAYIVFTNMQLEEFGNRIPRISFEVTQASTTDIDSFIETEPSIANPGRAVVDRRRRELITATGSAIRIYRTDDLSLVSAVSTTNVGTTRATTVDRKGNVYYEAPAPSNSKGIRRINPRTGEILNTFGFSSSGLSSTTINLPSIRMFAYCDAVGLDGPRGFVVSSSASFAHPMIFDENLNYVWGATSDPIFPGGSTFINDFFSHPNTASNGRSRACAGRTQENGSAQFFIVSTILAGGEFYYERVSVTAAARYRGFDIGIPEPTSTGITREGFFIDVNDVFPGGAGSIVVEGLFYDVVDDTVVIGILSYSPQLSNRLVKVQGSTVLWVSEINIRVNSDRALTYDPVTEGGTFGFITTGRNIRVLDLRDGSLITDLSTNFPSPASVANYYGYWDSQEQSLLYFGVRQFANRWIKVLWNRATPGGTSLSSVVSDLSQRAGLTVSQIDTSLLSGTVEGYAVARPTTMRAAIEQLAVPYHFDAVESDRKIKFVQRGGSPVATVDDQWLKTPQGALSPADKWVHNRAQEQDLPRQINVTYPDVDADYLSGTQYERRVVSPLPTMAALAETSIEIPVVMSGDRARAVAQNLLYSAWIERDRYQTELPWRFLRLDPTDVVTVVTGGSSYLTRMIESDIGADFTVSAEFLSQQPGLYSDSEAGAAIEIPPQVLRRSQPSIGFYLDIPLLRDVDDRGRTSSNWYFGASGYISGWPGARIYEGLTATTLEPFRDMFSPVTWGTVGTPLPNVENPFKTDETTVLRVALAGPSAELESVTQEQMLNGANVALVGSEIIQFRDVNQISDSVYELSGLLRGRRGTDVYVGSHEASETFILLTTDTIEKGAWSLSDLGNQRFFKAVTAETFVADTELSSKTFVGKDLFPYAPGDVRRLEDEPDVGDTRWTWKRRTRLNGELQDFIGTVPLNEDTEEYEAYIIDDLVDPLTFDPTDPANYLRSFTGLTDPEVVYTDAMKTADSFDPNADHAIVIYQISAQVGRGFPRGINYPA